MNAEGYFLVAPQEQLVKRTLEVAEPAPGEAVVEVEACGLCHTDLGFAGGAVSPRHALPLVLGHEVVGRVVAVGEDVRELVGRPVLVPAVLPCGECVFCRAGRGNAARARRCRATTCTAASRPTCWSRARSWCRSTTRPPASPREPGGGRRRGVDGLPGGAALRPRGGRRRLRGRGGRRGRLRGADRPGARGAGWSPSTCKPERLAARADRGAERTVAAGEDEQEVRKEAHVAATRVGHSLARWRVFECSGTPAGQALAFALLAPRRHPGGGRLHPREGQAEALEPDGVRRHGARHLGLPARRPTRAVLAARLRGKVALEPFIDHAPMSRAQLAARRHGAHRLTRRMVLTAGVRGGRMTD